MRAWPARDSRALFGEAEACGADLAVVALNQPLPPCAPRLWRAAALRVAADGGANRLYDELPALLPHLSAQQARAGAQRQACPRRLVTRAAPCPTQAREQHVPHVVLGDLDSARPEVLEFYAARGARVVDASTDQARPFPARRRRKLA